MLITALTKAQAPPVVAPPIQPVLQASGAPVLIVPPPVQTFTPPIAPVNSAAGASPSLRALFPDIESACITAVITHELRAADLYKLDPRLNDSDPTYNLTASGAFEMNVSKHKAYKTLNSVLLPLNTYFSILTVHTKGSLAAYFARHTAHLVTLASEYEWAAVLEYHTIFFNRRRGDMLEGSYTQWGEPDLALLAQSVFPHRKQISTGSSLKGPGKRTNGTGTSTAGDTCRNYNFGRCESPCAWKRMHVCSSPGCGKDHPLTQHPK
ncbi:hypothetical protein B0H15DRAFT_788808 [Mycena belliarum]|uniref:Uncharacterized protein n=1 Tax=Mycena belliarum TaxID=1033014 RepID=A0AAD6TW89_9AGAR|nr:hypothetical protein B0H15DRAFT_788808 [Mycena belliae]